MNCPEIVVGYANYSPLKDSTLSYAFQDAAVNSSAWRHVTVKGEQTFWGTEAGNYRIQSSTREVIDESDIRKARALLTMVDFAGTNGCMIVLAADTNCNIPALYKERVNLSLLNSPQWTEDIPKSPGFLYAVGLAPQYYYQSSSWKEAEWMARRNLARSLQSKIQGVQKSSREGQSIEQLSSDVVLRNVEVVERWLDIHQQIFYVLIRAKVH
jgi:hypothetical protein